MPPTLSDRVRAVERRVQRLKAWYAVSGIVLAAFGIVIAAVSADYFLRFHDSGLRWMWSLGSLAGLGWMVWRWVSPLLQQQDGQVVTAQRIERHFPQLHGRLSSAIAFLSQSPADPTAGSLDLRKAVVAEADALSADFNFQDVIEPRHPKRLMAAAGMAAIVLAGLAALWPAHARLGLVRLAMPWSQEAWPARHALALAAGPQLLAKGDDFEAQVVDRNGELPQEVYLQVRDQASGSTASHPMKRLGDAMVFRIDNVIAPFSYRAVGGDDYTMAWTKLEVVAPSKVIALEMEVTPPAYSSWPKQQGGKLIRALAGSQLALRGSVDKPIRSAVLKWNDGQSLPIRVSIGPDRMSFFAPADAATPWIAEKSGEIWCEVTDESGLPTGRQERVEVQVVADTPPTISWELPSDHTFVTSRARIPIRALVKDDLAVARVELRYLRPDASDQGEQVVELYGGRKMPTPAADANPLDGSGQVLTLDTAWDLELIPGLADGAVLAVRLVAEDFRPQTATAAVRRLTVISEEELESRVVQQQSSILSQLAEVLRVEREARDQTAALQIRFKELGRLELQDLSHLQSAELNQRQVQRLLSDPQDGVEARISALLAELSYNRVSSQAAAERMKDLLEKVRQLSRQELSGISHELTAALKLAQARAERDGAPPPGDRGTNCVDDDDAGVKQSLQTAGEAQDRVIAALEGLLGDLSQWDNFSRLSREVGQIRDQEQALADDTDQLRLEMAASDAPESAANRATSRQLARRQLEVARRYEKLHTRMDEMRRQLGSSDPQVAGALADALDAARRLAIGGKMRSTAGDLSDIRPGPAQQTQQEVLSGLAELLDILSRRRDAELARSTHSLTAAAGDVARLAQRQQALRQALQGAAADAETERRRAKLERLRQEAKKLSQEVQDLARKLERLQARRAAQAATQSADAMERSAQAAGDDQPDDAQAQAAAAQDLLEETRRELVAQIRQLQQDLAREQLARLEQQLAGIIARQSNVVQETERLDAIRTAEGGTLPAAQQATLRSTAAEQRLLADEAPQLLKSMDASAILFSLDMIQNRMLKAAEQMERGDTGAATQELERDALRRLEQIREALKSDEQEGASPPDDSQQPADQAGNPTPPPAQNLAELKLLKLMQEEIQRQTAEVEKLRLPSGELTADHVRRLEELAREQGKLADMVVDMIQRAAERPEDGLPELPDSVEKQPPGGDKNRGKPGSLDEELLQELEGKR